MGGSSYEAQCPVTSRITDELFETVNFLMPVTAQVPELSHMTVSRIPPRVQHAAAVSPVRDARIVPGDWKRKAMNNLSQSKFPRAIAAVVSLLLVGSVVVLPQDKAKQETIHATAMGQMRASGKIFSVTINIASYSTPTDQQTLIDAFNAGGHDALAKTLNKMKSKGRVAITGTLGYDIAYVRTFPTENGRRIRLITNRPIQFKEAYVNGRTTDYDLSAIELNLSKEKKDSDGSLIVAARFKTDKDKQIVLESYGSGPWRMVNIVEWQ